MNFPDIGRSPDGRAFNANIKERCKFGSQTKFLYFPTMAGSNEPGKAE